MKLWKKERNELKDLDADINNKAMTQQELESAPKIKCMYKIGGESLKRLKVAFECDKYVKELRKRMFDILAYSSVPFCGGEPRHFKEIKSTYDFYCKEWWGDLIDDKPKNDSYIAMGYALMVHHQQKLLSTKHKTDIAVLETIDCRLTLYVDYLRYWLDNKRFGEAMSLFEKCKVFGYLPINLAPEPMTFTQWLYQSGYEGLLDNWEFLDAIRYFDNL